jgi:hypothetical protein
MIYVFCHIVYTLHFVRVIQWIWFVRFMTGSKKDEKYA